MSESANTELLAARVRQEFNTHTAKRGDLAGLNTTDKTSVVAAINEANTNAQAGPAINDAGTSTTDVLSANQIDSRIAAANDALVGGAPGMLDTLGEISAALSDNPNAITAIETQAANNTTAAATAQTTADNAQISADAASTAAGTAQTTADGASTAAGAAQTLADSNVLAIAQVASDLGPAVDYVATFETGLLAP